MSEESAQMDPEGGKPLEPISHQRIMVLMGVITLTGSLAGFLFGGSGFGSGILLGGALSLVGYFWLKGSLGAMFERAVAGEPTSMQAARFFLRYVAIGAVLFLIYLSGAFPMIAVLLGLASFAGAVIIEGFSRALSGFNTNKEDR